jgi:hypothetical protein
MKYKIIIAVVIVVVVAGGIVLAMHHNSSNNQVQSLNQNSNATAQSANTSSQAQAPAQPAATTTNTTVNQITPQPKTATPSPTPPGQPLQPSAEPQVPPPPIPATDNFSTSADDSSASPDTFTAHAGDNVKLTLNVKTTGVYYGGLDFRSSVVNSGTILPGSSKTLSFTAGQSFDIHAFWPSSGVEKTTAIHIVVQ